MTIEALFAITATVFVIVFGTILLRTYFRMGNKRNYSSYTKKSHLFESAGEFELFKTLVELGGDKYYVFPQVHFSRLLEIKSQVKKLEVGNYRSRMDRKPADFVLCDKEHGAPRLVVELGGEGHNFPNPSAKNDFIDDVSKVAGLPVVHLKAGMTKEAIQAELVKGLVMKP